jgi:hypothetical protein
MFHLFGAILVTVFPRRIFWRKDTKKILIEIDERHWQNGKIHCNKQNKISKNNKEKK